jgi:hypothetical protein
MMHPASTLTSRSGADPSRPSGGLRSGTTRQSASPRPTGPLVELRGAPGTQTPAHSDGHGFHPTRTAFRRPPGTRGPGPAEPDCSGRRPPLRFRSPTEVHRDTPAPSRRSEDRPVGRCFLPWAFAPCDTYRDGGPAFRGASRPRCVPRAGFEHPQRGVHHRPSRRLAAPERPSASPSKAFSSRRSGRLSASPALVALLASIRLAPRGACGRGRLQGFDPGANSYGPPDPEGPGASLPSWASPSRALTPSGLGPRFGSRSLPSHALGGLTSCPTCVPGSCGTEGSVGPSRGYRLSWGSSPCDRRGHVPAGARGGLMASPHGSRALQAARTDLCPVALRPGRRRSADPWSAVHR